MSVTTIERENGRIELIDQPLLTEKFKYPVLKKILISEAKSIITEDKKICRAIGRNDVMLINISCINFSIPL